MTITNPILARVIRWIYRNKVKRFSFTYEKEIYEDDVLDQTYVRQYIADLQTAVEDEIAMLTEEYHL